MATILFFVVSACSVLFSTGYSMPLGDESMSMSLEDSSKVFTIFLVYTIFRSFWPKVMRTHDCYVANN